MKSFEDYFDNIIVGESMNVGASELLRKYKKDISTMIHKELLSDEDLDFDIVRQSFVSLFQNLKENQIK